MKQLTDDEINLVVESLLFSSCLEITDEWSDDDRFVMIQIADKLKNLNTSLKNIELHDLNNEASKITQKINSLFPAITKVQYITPTTTE